MERWSTNKYIVIFIRKNDDTTKQSTPAMVGAIHKDI
jgi:hypothetical protein